MGASRVIYATIRIDLYNEKVDEITDEMVEDFVDNTICSFSPIGDVEVYDTSWCNTEY